MSEQEKKSPQTTQYLSLEALSYKPNERDILMPTKKGVQRLIFYNKEWSDMESSNLQIFKKYCEDSDFSLQRYDKQQILRHLQGNDFKMQDTKKSIEFAAEWNSMNMERILTSHDVQNLLNTGIMYFCGRDMGFRPVLIVNVKQIINFKLTGEDLIDLTVYLINWAKKNLLVNGVIQNWSIIIDMKDVSTTKIPKDKLNKITKVMQGIERGRLFKLFTINMPMLAYALWKIAKVFVNKYTLMKIDIQRKDLKPLHSCVNLDNLEAKYGGKLQNLQHEFFPPKYMV